MKGDSSKRIICGIILLIDTSVAESEAKLDPSACDSLVGGVATSALMKLIPPPISDANSNDSLVFLTKNIGSKTSKTVTQSSIRSQSKPYSHPPTNLRAIYNDTCKAKRVASFQLPHGRRSKRNVGLWERANFSAPPHGPPPGKDG
jgi:hypothetical protein